MSLSHAIRRNASSLADAQTTYKQNVASVDQLMNTVFSSNLPTLQTNPPDWQDFVAAYEAAKTGALSWVNTVSARLHDVPGEVQNFNPVITQLLQDAQQQANTLVNNPSDSQALQILDNDLTLISQQLGLVVTFISGAVTNLQHFQDSLPALAAALQAVADKSAHDAGADQAQIQTLLDDISALQADITSNTAAIVALAITDGIALTIGTVATIALWPVGALVWFVMGPAVAVATYEIAMDAINIENDKKKIEADKSSITGLTADVAALQALAKSYGDMASESAQIETTLQAILAEWLTLESEVNAAITDARTALADAGAANFQAVAADLTDAVTEWNAAYAQAGSLNLDVQVNTAQLSIGMNADQVSATLAAGQTMSFVDYINLSAGSQLQLAA